MDYRVGKQGGKLGRIILVVLIFLVLVGVVGAGGAYRTYHAKLGPVSSSAESTLIVIESGSTADQIASQLSKAGLIQSTTVFKWYVRIHNVRDQLKAGSYYLRPNMTTPEVIGIITQGRVATDLLTILPGKRIDQVKQAFVKANYNQAEVDAAFQTDQYRDIPLIADLPAGTSLEGYLYPDSYQKTATTKPAVIVRQSLEAMQQHVTPDLKAGFARQGLTVQQGVALASVVEKEVSHTTDMAKVAQVFELRMKQGISLGSDVTALYGAIHDGLQLPSDSAAATAIALSHDSPYNTRMHAGLPPGPISNVGASALQAVANPSNTDYLFFVAGDDGTTYFSHTVQEHEANVAQYCHKLCGR